MGAKSHKQIASNSISNRGSITISSLHNFRDDVRNWLEANCPESQRQPIVKEEQIWGGRRRVFPSDDARTWFERMRDKGWTAPEWPAEYGGGGLSAEQGGSTGGASASASASSTVESEFMGGTPR